MLLCLYSALCSSAGGWYHTRLEVHLSKNGMHDTELFPSVCKACRPSNYTFNAGFPFDTSSFDVSIAPTQTTPPILRSYSLEFCLGRTLWCWYITWSIMIMLLVHVCFSFYNGVGVWVVGWEIQWCGGQFYDHWLSVSVRVWGRAYQQCSQYLGEGPAHQAILW